MSDTIKSLGNLDFGVWYLDSSGEYLLKKEWESVDQKEIGWVELSRTTGDLSCDSAMSWDFPHVYANRTYRVYAEYHMDKVLAEDLNDE